MLQLFDVNKNKIKGLSAYKDYCIESKLKTGDKTLSFLYPKHLSKELKEEGYIRNKTDEFVIKEISNSGNYKSIKAVLNVEDLEGKEWEHFTTTNQTINQCISLALAGTGWTLRMIDNISKKRTIKKTNCNSWDIIQEARKTYNAEIEFDTISKIVKVAERLGSDKGAYFIDSLNLKDLKSQSNSYDFYTRIVALGKDDLKVIVENFKYSNKTKTLIWKDEKYTDEASLREDAIIKLDEISKPYHAYDADILDLANMSDKYKDILSYKLGDVITLISKDEYIREKQRIVSMKVWPDKPEKNSCEIANTILSFEDLQKEHQNTADTVNNITSDNGTISEGAIQGVVKKLVVDKADINSLNAVEIRVGDIEATKANITELKVTNANVDKLTANKADVIQLNAVSEKVNLLEADSANIKTLVAGNITADNIQSDLLQSLKGWMLEGSIGNAQISDLDANKIKSGTVDTSLVTVAGPQGRLKLQGNKLQVLDSKDNALYERIMLGVDENNNSALILRGTDGKTILLNQDGLTKAGFTDGYNKIDNNSLDGSKLDINSVVRKVNGATEKISSTVVQAGDKSLNVLLQEQNNNITEHGKNLATQEARITANEKAINLKVDSQTYATDKTTINKNIETTLTNSKAYADDKKSEAISTAATDATTKANAAKDSAVSTAASDATTKANNAKDTAISEAQKKADKALSDSKAYVNQEITTVNSNLSKATSEISVLKGQIALKVEQGDIDKTVTTVKNELDSKIADVTTTTDTKINTAKSEIKAETDKIKLSVTGLDSKTKAIETQMDDKATKSEVKTVSDKAASIEANLGAITQKVSNVEQTTSTLNGKVVNQENRLKTAEQKITDSAIISTVKNAKTNGKATFATTSSVEQFADSVNFKFDSVGSPNILRNTYFENRDTSGWNFNGLTKYFSNPEVFTPTQGWVAFQLSGGDYGNDRGLMYQYLSDNYCLSRATTYTFSLSSITEKNIGDFKLYVDYCYKGRYVCNRQIDLKLGPNYKRYGVTFDTPDDLFDEVKFYLDFRRKPGTSGYVVASIGLPCLCVGSSTAYNNRSNEVYSGNTRVSYDGVTIYNGALTVKNRSGIDVIKADSNGDITLSGKLQPNDHTLRLFEDECLIDGGLDALRLKYSWNNYISIGKDNRFVMYTSETPPSGNKYFYVLENSDGHTTISNTKSTIKLLGQSYQAVQFRNGSDNAYIPVQASDFINNSTIKAKANISSLNIENAINIIKENNVRNYQLKSDIDNEIQQENVEYDNKSVIYASNAPIKTGLIIEELTPQAKALLVPKDTDCISLYSMVSLLWGVVQEQQKEIEELKSLVNRG